MSCFLFDVAVVRTLFHGFSSFPANSKQSRQASKRNKWMNEPTLGSSSISGGFLFYYFYIFFSSFFVLFFVNKNVLYSFETMWSVFDTVVFILVEDSGNMFSKVSCFSVLYWLVFTVVYRLQTLIYLHLHINLIYFHIFSCFLFCVRWFWE